MASQTRVVADNLDGIVGDAVPASGSFTSVGVSGDIEIGASIFTPPTTVNASTYSLLTTDSILHVTYTATGSVALELPTAQCIDGRIITVKDAGNLAGTNNIVISTEGAEQIEFGDSVVINANGDSLDIYAENGNWFVR